MHKDVECFFDCQRLKSESQSSAAIGQGSSFPSGSLSVEVALLSVSVSTWFLYSLFSSSFHCPRITNAPCSCRVVFSETRVWCHHCCFIIACFVCLFFVRCPWLPISLVHEFVGGRAQGCPPFSCLLGSELSFFLPNS